MACLEFVFLLHTESYKRQLKSIIIGEITIELTLGKFSFEKIY